MADPRQVIDSSAYFFDGLQPSARLEEPEAGQSYKPSGQVPVDAAGFVSGSRSLPAGLREQPR